jgi:hypothetical protein
MAKLQGAERARALDVIAQSDVIHRFEGFEPTELVKQLDQAVLDGLATHAQIAAKLEEYITKHRTTEGFLESRPWLRTHSAV